MVRQIEAVIFDWAGTTVDHGSLAPVKAVTEVFALRGIAISGADARRDMGIYKKDHIRNILHMPAIAALWRARAGSDPSERDVEDLFQAFIPLQFESLARHSRVIDGVTSTVARLRERGLKIGGTTGYTRPMMDILAAAAAEQGYKPEVSFCPDDVGGGRPLPWMCLKAALELKLTSVAAAVKVGDTASDIAEALNAGMWAVGVAATGNELGLTSPELAGLSGQERKRRLDQAERHLLSVGSHYVIESVNHILPIVDKIDLRLSAGETP